LVASDAKREFGAVANRFKQAIAIVALVVLCMVVAMTIIGFSFPP
jgi:hypothetical protein